MSVQMGDQRNERGVGAGAGAGVRVGVVVVVSGTVVAVEGENCKRMTDPTERTRSPTSETLLANPECQTGVRVHSDRTRTVQVD
jgi:hypothetical protein